MIVIDIQNAFLKYIPERDKEVGLEYINWAIALFREQGLPVYHVYHTDPKIGPDPESDAFQFPEMIKIEEGDSKIVKNYPSAFKKTELANMLDEEEINTVFLVGLSAVGCVMATYWGGLDLDYTMVMVKDAVMSHDSDLTDYAEAITDAMSLGTVKFMLEHL